MVARAKQAGAVNATGTSRAWAIVAIVVLHGLLFWLWPHYRPHDSPVSAREVFVTLVSAKPKQVAPPTRASARKPVAITRRPRPLLQTSAPPEKLVEPVAMTMQSAPSAPSEPDPFAEPTQAEKPKYDIAKVDKEVRRQSLNPAVRETVLQATRMERLIGGAKTQRGPAVVEELVMNDGTRVSKVGGMCARKKPSAMVGGLDPFRSGNETVWQQCPK